MHDSFTHSRLFHDSFDGAWLMHDSWLMHPWLMTHCVAVCCSVLLQFVAAVCCSVLHSFMTSSTAHNHSVSRLMTRYSWLVTHDSFDGTCSSTQMRKACHTQTSEKAQDTSSRVCCSVSRCVAVGRQKTLRVDCVEVHRSVLQCVAVKGHQTPGVKYLLLSIYTMITYIQYIHIYTYVYVYAYIYTYIYICIHVYT